VAVLPYKRGKDRRIPIKMVRCHSSSTSAATFAAAGLYGILNGWLAVDGSATWWPLTPPPMPVEFNLSLEPDDLTAPSVRNRRPESAADLTPVTRIINPRSPPASCMPVWWSASSASRGCLEPSWSG
jgi:hypothetical protein